MKYDIVNASVIGKKHEEEEDVNQDFLKVDRLRNILLLSDGMGGHNSGEEASKTVIDKVYDQMIEAYRGLEEGDYKQENISNIIRDQIIPYANNFVYSAGSLPGKVIKAYENLKKIQSKHGDLDGLVSKALDNLGPISRQMKEYSKDVDQMGATLDACIIYNDIAHIGHVGNGRVYHINKHGTITKLTREHVDYGKANLPRLDETIVERGLGLTNYMGQKSDIPIDMYEIPLSVDDRLLFATDGLTHTVSESEMVVASRDMDEAVFNLLNFVENPGWMAEAYSRMKNTSLEEAQKYLGLRDDTSFILVKRLK
ncbi:protein phosphatase 2C domain-containing protein [Candidatus Woesearchaeota archaeon]|nr:protein phosphatase 2C domain-containing protein [Candidatus Woesearchaeota archaeon]